MPAEEANFSINYVNFFCSITYFLADERVVNIQFKLPDKTAMLQH
jgi:hypothetical protein